VTARRREGLRPTTRSERDHGLVPPDIGVPSVREDVGRNSDRQPMIAGLVLPYSVSTLYRYK